MPLTPDSYKATLNDHSSSTDSNYSPSNTEDDNSVTDKLPASSMSWNYQAAQIPTHPPSDWATLFKTAYASKNHPVHVSQWPTGYSPTEQDYTSIGSTFCKSHPSLQFLSFNMNTLKLHDDLAELHDFCYSIAEYNVAIIGIQEINLNLLDSEIRAQITNMFKRHFSSIKILFSTTPIPSTTSWKPDRKILVIIGPISHCITTSTTDKLGQ